MRLDGSSQYVARQAAESLAIGGQRIERGQSVVVLLAAANLDPRRFTEPKRFRIDRAEGRHLGFGLGRHHCIGSVDTEQAARIAVGAFVDRYDFTVAGGDDAISWGEHANTRCPERVLVDVRPRRLRPVPDPPPAPAPAPAPARARLDLGQRRLERRRLTSAHLGARRRRRPTHGGQGATAGRAERAPGDPAPRLRPGQRG
jgi:Cytochrome P450